MMMFFESVEIYHWPKLFMITDHNEDFDNVTIKFT